MKTSEASHLTIARIVGVTFLFYTVAGITTLAQLGVIASALLAVVLPLQLVGLFGGSTFWASSIAWLVWLPVLVFEVMLALWLMIKGVNFEQWEKRTFESV
jgi:hypothetical protein